MSNDDGRELIGRLEKSGTSAILITWKTTKNGQIRKGDQLRVQASDSLDNNATAQKLLAVAVELNKHLGILPKDFLDDYVPADQ